MGKQHPQSGTRVKFEPRDGVSNQQHAALIPPTLASTFQFLPKELPCTYIRATLLGRRDDWGLGKRVDEHIITELLPDSQGDYLSMGHHMISSYRIVPVQPDRPNTNTGLFYPFPLHFALPT